MAARLKGGGGGGGGGWAGGWGGGVNEITLPLHTKLSDAEVTYVAETYASVVKPYIQKREKGTC